MDRYFPVIRELAIQSNLPSAISKLLIAAARIVSADRCTLFMVDRSPGCNYLYVGLSKGSLKNAARHRHLRDIRVPIDRSSIAGWVAYTGDACRVDDAYADHRFDRAVDERTGYRTRTILAIPLKDNRGNVIAVLQAVNKTPVATAEAGVEGGADTAGAATAAAPAPIALSPPVLPPLGAKAWPTFTTADIAALTFITDFAGVVLHRLTLTCVASAERARAEEMVRLLQQISSASTSARFVDVVEAVINACYRLLQCERVTLFLVDESRRSLVITSSQDVEGVHVPINRGLAGYCATRGLPLVVPKASEHPAFDGRLDVATGFRTVSVACMPIRDSNGAVVGVLQAINRLVNGSSPFNHHHAQHSAPHMWGSGGVGGGGSHALPPLPLLGLDDDESDGDSDGDDSDSFDALGGGRGGGGGGDTFGGLRPADAPAPAAGDAFTFDRRLTTPRDSLTPAGSWRFGSGGEADSAATAAAVAATAASAAAAAAAEAAVGPPAPPPEPWPFVPADEEVMAAMAAHAAVALRSAQMLEEMARARKMTAGLLDIVQSAASESSVTVSQLLQKIIDAAYSLLDCERVTLYLVDSVKQELWMALSKDVEAIGARIPLGQGIAGTVAATGVYLNIGDAYGDPRFDSSFDMATGFRTQSMLVWPIALTSTVPGHGGKPPSHTSSVIAVLQAINKRSTSLIRVASSDLMRKQSRIGSLFAGGGDGRSMLPTPKTASVRYDRATIRGAGSGTSSGVTSAAGSRRSSGHAGMGSGPGTDSTPEYARFDAADEKAMGAFCAEVAIALKRRSVEAAFLKVIADASEGGSAAGTRIPDELNVSLLALYTDAGTSARLHTSVLVRQMTVQQHTPLPLGLRSMRHRAFGTLLGGDGEGAAAGAAAAAPAGGVGAGTGAEGAAGRTTSLAAAAASAGSATPVGEPPALPPGGGHASSQEIGFGPGARVWSAAHVAATAAAAGVATATTTTTATATSGAGATATTAGGSTTTPTPTLTLATRVSPAAGGGDAALARTSPAAVGAASARRIPAGEELFLSMDDPRLTWSWNIFDLPIAGVPNVWGDPLDQVPSKTGSFRMPPMNAEDVARGEMRLTEAVVSMFNQFSLLKRFNIDEGRFSNFMRAVRSRYHPNPFHNYYHAVAVLHATFLLLGTTNAADMLEYRDILCAMIAAYGHDIDHPGTNNGFEVNSYSPLALAHNDDGVLERHHAHTLFRVLLDARERTDILSVLPAAEFRACRQTIIRAILHTDMTKHFGCINDLADRSVRYYDAIQARVTAEFDSPRGALGRSISIGSSGGASSGPPGALSARSDGSRTAGDLTARVGDVDDGTGLRDDDDGVLDDGDSVDSNFDPEFDGDRPGVSASATPPARSAPASISTTVSPLRTSAAPSPTRGSAPPSPSATSSTAPSAAGGVGIGVAMGAKRRHSLSPVAGTPAPAVDVTAGPASSPPPVSSPAFSPTGPGGAMPQRPAGPSPAAGRRPPPLRVIVRADTTDSTANAAAADAAVAAAVTAAEAGASGGPPSPRAAPTDTTAPPPAPTRPVLMVSGSSSTPGLGSVSQTPKSSTVAPRTGQSAGSGGGAACAPGQTPLMTGRPMTVAAILSPKSMARASSMAPRGGSHDRKKPAFHSKMGNRTNSFTPSTSGGGLAGTLMGDTSLQLRYADILPFDRSSETDRNELVAVIVHTADLSGQAYPRATSNNWSARIVTEFRNQAAKERAMGLPVAPFMAALETPLQVARLQHSFVKNIVLPLWQRVAELLVNLAEPLGNLNGARLGFESEEARAERDEANAKTAAGAAAAAPAAAVAVPAPATVAAPLSPLPHVPSALTSHPSIMVASEEAAEVTAAEASDATATAPGGSA